MRPSTADLKNSVFAIGVIEDDSSIGISGTCFAISRTKVITAYHNVVDCADTGLITKKFNSCAIGKGIKKMDH